MSKGSKHILARTVREMTVAEAPAIVASIIRKAKAGDPHSRELFMRHLFPRTRYISDPFAMPAAETAREAAKMIGVAVSRAAGGLLDLQSMQALIQGLASFAAVYETAELEDRLLDVTPYDPPREGASEFADEPVPQESDPPA
jgi:hypothetical protein